MDIKLKKSNKRTLTVILAFLICVSSFVAALTVGSTQLINTARLMADPFEVMASKTYDDSGTLQSNFYSQFNRLCWGMSNEEGQNVNTMLSGMRDRGFSFYVTDGNTVFTNIDSLMNAGVEAPDSENWENTRNTQPASAKTLETLGQQQGAYRLFSNGRLTGEPKIRQGSYYGDRYLNDRVSEDISPLLGEDKGGQRTIYMAFSKEYVSTEKQLFEDLRSQMMTSMMIALVCGLTSLIAFIALCAFCGKRDETGNSVLTGIDRWFTELLLAGFAFCVFMGIFVAVSSTENNYYDYNSYYENSPINTFQAGIMAAGLWAAGAASLFLLMSLVKKIKAGRFLQDFFVVRIILWVINGLRDIYYGSSVMRKVVIVIALMCLLSATVIFFPVVIVISIVFAARWVKQYEAIKDGVREVKGGNPSYKIPIQGEPRGELQQLASDINAISKGFDVAVKQELKNQRLKTELISNVSHDIKTPLTSIITYVDLLKKEGLDCEDAPKYLDILDQKSIRLKKLTEDLFEAAKASSGDIPVNLGRVELLSLLNQTLGEMDDRLASKGLDVIIKADQDKYYVRADGQLMWRILENLFGNAIKYALENSRVYVDIRQLEIQPGDRTAAVLEMKNVSRDPLNIPADELMERFKRGDESRNTEGSGLGLSIARDLMHIQQGRFDIVIDGDLFKAIISLDTCK